MTKDSVAVQGTAWVSEGKVYVKDPVGDGEPAVIAPPQEGAIVYVQGKRIYKETKVTESLGVSVDYAHVKPQVKYSVEIDKDGLKAYLTLNANNGSQYRLIDKEPSNRLVLEVDKKEIPCEPQLADLKSALADRGIVYGIDENRCQEICMEMPTERVLVAKGDEAVPGTDGKIDFLVELERIVDLPLDADRVNFRDYMKTPDIREGEAIAVKTHPTPGKSGKSVTGKVLHPPKPKDPKFLPGKNIQMVQEDNVTIAKAKISGCPKWAVDLGLVDVDDVLMHKGDIDLASGNLKSSGSLQVSGDVKEGMTVECEGNQEIYGSVAGSVLKAWGNITIRQNVFKSQIFGGKDALWLQKWDEMLSEVESKIATIKEMEYHNSMALEDPESQDDKEENNESLMVEEFRSLLVALSVIYKEDLKGFPDEISAVIAKTKESLLATGQDIFTRTKSIESHLAEVRGWIEKELLQGKSDIMLPYAQNCTIHSSRDIIFTGQGAYYCNLTAGRAIKSTGSPGLIRGGEARAPELIKVKTAGGQGVGLTILRVSEGGTISADVVQPNTLLCVGHLRARTENLLHSVHVSVSHGRLQISSKQGTTEVGY